MYEKKLELLIEAGRKIRNARAALEYQVGELRPLRIGARINPVKLIFDNEIGWLDGPTTRETQSRFEKAYNCLNEMDSERDVGVNGLRADIELLKLNPRPPHIASAINRALRMLKDNFSFSDKPSEFGVALYDVTLLFASSKGEHQRVDYLAMIALFHAGKVLGHLEARGREKSDKQGKRGRKKMKNRYSDKEIIFAFHHCDGKNMHDMGVDIWHYLSEHKKKTEDKRGIPSDSTIRRALINAGLDKKLKNSS